MIPSDPNLMNFSSLDLSYYSQLSINAPPLGPDTRVHLERVCIYREIRSRDLYIKLFIILRIIKITKLKQLQLLLEKLKQLFKILIYSSLLHQIDLFFFDKLLNFIY